MYINTKILLLRTQLHPELYQWKVHLIHNAHIEALTRVTVNITVNILFISPERRDFSSKLISYVLNKILA